jgi:small subunit ribosomal protein S12
LSTYNYKYSHNSFKNYHTRRPALQANPQQGGVVMRARIVTPRKPNSARRPVAKVVLNSYKRLTAHIPGKAHNARRHSSVLIRGRGARDLPGVRYTCIRGVYDIAGVLDKTKRRSIYGIKQTPRSGQQRRRKFRKL